MKLKVIREVEVTYVRVCLPIHYGDEDIPFGAPLRLGDKWEALIRLDTGTIYYWPKGETLEFYMKVCDQGIYHLEDFGLSQVASIVQDYIPLSLIPGEDDHVHFKINENGVITNWPKNGDLTDFEDVILREGY